MSEPHKVLFQWFKSLAFFFQVCPTFQIFSWIQRFPHAPWAYAAEALTSFINLSDIPLGLTVQLRLDGVLGSSPVLFGLRIRGPVLDSIGIGDVKILSAPNFFTPL